MQEVLQKQSNLRKKSVVDCFFLDLSELPDIRLWFSSYVYESPVLGSSNDFGDSLGKESQCENVGFVIEGSNTEKEDILGESYKSRNNGELIGDEMLHSDVALRCICSGNKEHKLPSSREVYHSPATL